MVEFEPRMKSEIERLKKEARRHYLAHQNGVGDFSCGASLAAHLRPSLGVHATKFNNTMAKLREIDPNCPPFDPLPTG